MSAREHVKKQSFELRQRIDENILTLGDIGASSHEDFVESAAFALEILCVFHGRKWRKVRDIQYQLLFTEVIALRDEERGVENIPKHER